MALRLLLIAVAFYTSRGIRLFASGPQIPVGGFSLEHISTGNCSFALLHLLKSCSGFPLRFIDLIILHGRRRQLRQALCGGNPGGEYADEPASPTHEVRLTFLVYDDEQF